MSLNIKKKLFYDINVLNLDKTFYKIFSDNRIFNINDLWVLNKKNLKDMGFTDKDIKQIVIKMQLLGLDLNKKVYKNY